jgi:vacuolar-type H+-ATPase subunit E/Vma4
MRGLLDRLFAEAEARLRAAPDAALTARLLESLLPELAGGSGTLEVEPAHAELARGLAPPGFTVTPRAVGGGVVARLDDGLVLDDSAASRLASARPALEPELARLLFGEDHARD